MHTCGPYAKAKCRCVPMRKMSNRSGSVKRLGSRLALPATTSINAPAGISTPPSVTAHGIELIRISQQSEQQYAGRAIGRGAARVHQLPKKRNDDLRGQPFAFDFSR